MKRTENVYKELRERIEGLVEFMASNGLNSADISLELNEEFTLCNVKYKDSDEIKDEFLYLFEDSKKLSETYFKKLATEENEPSNFNLCNNDSSEETGIYVEERLTSPEEPKNLDETTKLEKETTNLEKSQEQEIKQEKKDLTLNSNSKEDLKLDNSKSEELQDEMENENNLEEDNVEAKENNNKNSKSAINFKDEFIFQKEIILNILKEYNLIS